MKKTASVLVRATLLAFGLLWICKFFGGTWNHTREGLSMARDWIADHFVLLSGALLAAVSLAWRKGWDWITWFRGFLGIPESAVGKITLALAIFAILIGALNVDTVGLVCSFVLIWIGSLCIFLAPSEKPKPCPDFYHRNHLAERLGDLLLQTPDNIRRIGILAEWGEGKTQLMKLLDARLRADKTKKYRMAWVNPWRASSRDDAWIEIARGVDEALGFPRLLPQSILSIPGVGTILELLPKPLSGFTADLKTLLTSEGSAADKIATGLTDFLRRRNQWILIFVDDMERVGAKELRKVFPVVDRLVDLERCYFIFAIDPKRIAKAFKEPSADGDETKGYLDKILDLQISLPTAAKGEVFDMLNHRLDHSSCPRLSSVLPRLKDYLPLNPRLADRFLRDADGRERMFLSRFGADEENYEGFFLLVLLEVCYPRAFRKVSLNLAFFEDLRVSEMYGRGERESKFAELVSELAADHSSDEKKELEKLLKRLHTLSSMFLRYDVGEKALDLHWALEGYRKLIRFTVVERKSFVAEWALHSGQCSLDTLLKKVGDFSEPDLVVRQALELELEEIRHLFQEVYRVHFEERPLTELENRLSEHLGRFTKHAAAISAGRLSEFDRQIFGRELFDVWTKVLESSLLKDLPEQFIDRMMTARERLTRAWVSVFDPVTRYELGYSGFLDLIRSAPDEAGHQLRRELNPISDTILKEFSNQFVELMKHEHLPEFFPPPWMRSSSIRELLDPASWLPVPRGEAEKVLSELVADAETNDISRDNFVWLVRREFLSAYRLDPRDGFREQHGARRAIQANPWYLKACWKAIWSNPPIPGIARDLIRLRDRALKAEGAQQPPDSIAETLREMSVPEEFQSHHEGGEPVV